MFTVAVMEGEKKGTGRKAGILLHISSLPAGYATGDMGPEAYSFARFCVAADKNTGRCCPLIPLMKRMDFRHTDQLQQWQVIYCLSALKGLLSRNCYRQMK